MKRLLLLLPLLASCGPTVAGRSTWTGQITAEPIRSVGPFRVGQSLSFSSHSTTDALLPEKSVFVLKAIELGDNEYNLVLFSPSVGKNFDATYVLRSNSFYLFDTSPVVGGASKMRVCVFTDMDLGHSPYAGYSAHATPKDYVKNTGNLVAGTHGTLVNQIKNIVDRGGASKDQLAAAHNALSLAFVQTLAPDDNSDCLMDLGV